MPEEKSELEPEDQAKLADSPPEPVEVDVLPQDAVAPAPVENPPEYPEAVDGPTGFPDEQWVKDADIHTGDEPGEPERTEEKVEAVTYAQPDGPITQEHIDQIEQIEADKRRVSEEAVRKGPFEAGGEEENFLQSGVSVEHAEAERQKHHARMRRDAHMPAEGDEDLLAE